MTDPIALQFDDMDRMKGGVQGRYVNRRNCKTGINGIVVTSQSRINSLIPFTPRESGGEANSKKWMHYSQNHGKILRIK